MKIIAHRGFWIDTFEKNSSVAFQRAIDNGFGIETDLRDHNGQIVISHDPATGGEQNLNDFLNQVGDSGVNLAMNVKADGLSAKMAEIARYHHGIEDMVFFDMSGPEHLQYRKRQLKTLSRISEFEVGYSFDTPDFGVWLDSFSADSWRIDWLKENETRQNVYIVSPELHGRMHLDFWHELRKLDSLDNISLCTDFPLEASVFFGVKHD